MNPCLATGYWDQLSWLLSNPWLPVHQCWSCKLLGSAKNGSALNSFSAATDETCSIWKSSGSLGNLGGMIDSFLLAKLKDSRRVQTNPFSEVRSQNVWKKHLLAGSYKVYTVEFFGLVPSSCSCLQDVGLSFHRTFQKILWRMCSWTFVWRGGTARCMSLH